MGAKQWCLMRERGEKKERFSCVEDGVGGLSCFLLPYKCFSVIHHVIIDFFLEVNGFFSFIFFIVFKNTKFILKLF